MNGVENIVTNMPGPVSIRVEGAPKGMVNLFVVCNGAKVCFTDNGALDLKTGLYVAVEVQKHLGLSDEQVVVSKRLAKRLGVNLHSERVRRDEN